MLWEIVNSRGCYAAGQAKDWLKAHGAEVGIDEDSAYRIVQLAAFNVHEPSDWAKRLRENPADSFGPEDLLLASAKYKYNNSTGSVGRDSIQNLIARGELWFTDELAPTVEQIQVWNETLQKLFANDVLLKEWQELFQPSYLLRNERFLFQKIIGWTPGTPE